MITLWQRDLRKQLCARLVVDMDKETAGTSGGLAALVSLVRCCQHAVHVEKGCWALNAENQHSKEPFVAP